MRRSPLSLLRLIHSNPIRHDCTSAWPPPPPPKPSPLLSSIVDDISNLTLLELSDLTHTLRTRLRVDQIPAVAVFTPGLSAGGISGRNSGAEAAEEVKAEKTAFDLRLESFEAASKIKIIKEVRTFTDLGLKEAKELVEKAPAVIKRGVVKEEAEKIVEKMKLVGAKVVME